MEKAEKIERYFEEAHPFMSAINQLRTIALETEVDETFKWMFPTYTVNGKNVFAISKFNNHFAIWFFNGVFLKDKLQVLENAQEGKTKAMRHWKFTTIDEIDARLILAYMNEAIDNQKQGRVLPPQKKKAPKIVAVPQLLKNALHDNALAKAAFAKLSPSKKNEYCAYIETAKQEKTKLTRLAKILPLITEGKGLNDIYRK